MVEIQDLANVEWFEDEKSVIVFAESDDVSASSDSQSNTSRQL